ncbi:MAG: hypothetical protein H0T18_04240 [Chloroflexia bacterium]|nr:hypothetical protein [Chloroflexia bacterium]
MSGLFRMVLRLLPVLAMLMVAVTPGLVAAQQEIDAAFDDAPIRELGYPEVTVEVGPEGMSAPAELAAGLYLVTLIPRERPTAYVDIMQPPPGLGEDEATQLALDAAANDLAQVDWVYLGGSNTFIPNESVSFLIDLPPGEFVWAGSSYSEGGADEVMHLAPLTVTAADATPIATPVAPLEPDVVLEMTDDLTYIVTPDPVPAGPQIWEITNTGVHSAHHVVMSRVPDGTTSAQIVSELGALMSGTPPAGEPVFAQFVGVGYAALQSGGQTTWTAFDLDLATYAVICFIIDPVTGRPHVLDGMATVFTVE